MDREVIAAVILMPMFDAVTRMATTTTKTFRLLRMTEKSWSLNRLSSWAVRNLHTSSSKSMTFNARYVSEAATTRIEPFERYNRADLDQLKTFRPICRKMT